MAILGVKFCLSVLVACIIVSTPQGRSLRRRHGHRSYSDYYNLEKSLPRDLLSGRLEDDLDFRDTYGQTKRREHPRGFVLNRFTDDSENSEDQVPPSVRRYGHEYDSRDREESLGRKEDSPRKYLDDYDDALSMRFVARRKRYNKHDGNVYHRVYDARPQGTSEYFNNRSEGDKVGNIVLELELKEAQNRSVCNYTVESIPDVRGTRVPKDLEHVRCNHIGSKCQGAGTFCCIQTYRNIEVSYGNGDRETIKLYVGCVCAHQYHIINDLQASWLSVHD